MNKGKAKIEWVKRFMPVLSAIDREFSQSKPFAGVRVSITLHLEAKTAYMAQVFRNAGATVCVTGSNPLSTQDDVAEALAVLTVPPISCRISSLTTAETSPP